MNSPRSLLVNLAFLIKKPTGISTYATNLLPYLKPLDPTLLVAQAWDGFSCYSIPGNLTPEQGLKGHLRRLFWTQRKLPKIYRQLQAKLLFSPVPEAPLSRSCRSVVMVHDLIPLRFPRRRSGLTYYFRYGLPLTLKKAEHIVCNSSATAQELIEYFQIPETKITPIPLAYDSTQFRFLDLPRRNYFLYLGRPDPHKNLQRVIAAFAEYCRRSPASDLELWIGGTPDRRYTPVLAAQAQALGLGMRVKFLDYVPYEELGGLYNQAIALIFPSLWEGFGLPVVEAMACGTPVLTSHLSALPEAAGEAALLVNPYEVGEIAEAMTALAEDQQVWNQLHQAGLVRAKQFTWAKTGEATAAVLQRYL
jgi:glycosyltransferase involved in cell wall biosynthesis